MSRGGEPGYFAYIAGFDRGLGQIFGLPYTIRLNEIGNVRFFKRDNQADGRLKSGQESIFTSDRLLTCTLPLLLSKLMDRLR